MIRKNFLSFLSWRALVLLGLVLFISGCETWNGLKKDMDTLRSWDQEFQEVLW